MLVFYLGVVSTFNSPHIALFHSPVCCSLLPQASCTHFVSKPRLAHTRDLAVAHHVPGRVLSRVLERASSTSRASLEHTRASCLGTLHGLGLSQLLGAWLATVKYRYWRLPSRPWRQLHCSSIPFPFRMTVALREDVGFLALSIFHAHISHLSAAFSCPANPSRLMHRQNPSHGLLPSVGIAVSSG